MIFSGIYEEEGYPFTGRKLEKLKAFLADAGLSYDDTVEYSLNLVDEEDRIAATGSVAGGVLKCIAVSDAYRGEGLSARIVTGLVRHAMEKGFSHLFLFTKPKNQQMFEDLGFYRIIATEDILLMENRKGGIEEYVRSLKGAAEPLLHTVCAASEGNIVQGAVVANCNPFTSGHRYLIEEALKRCDMLHLFILSEDRSEFSAAQRYDMARRGTSDLPRVILHPTSDYLISSATFPTYFIKDKARAEDARCELDVRIFAECFAIPMGITKRFAGSEPEDVVTHAYNEAMAGILPGYGIEFVEVPRLLSADGRPVSAKTVRKLLSEGKTEEAGMLLPESTKEALA